MDHLRVPIPKRTESTFSSPDCSSLGSSTKENKFYPEECKKCSLTDFTLDSPGLYEQALNSRDVPDSIKADFGYNSIE